MFKEIESRDDYFFEELSIQNSNFCMSTDVFTIFDCLFVKHIQNKFFLLTSMKSSDGHTELTVVRIGTPTPPPSHTQASVLRGKHMALVAQCVKGLLPR